MFEHFFQMIIAARLIAIAFAISGGGSDDGG